MLPIGRTLLIFVVICILAPIGALADPTAERMKQLYQAIVSDDPVLVTKLLKVPEISINQRYPGFVSWLQVAARQCSVKVTPILLDGGLDPNQAGMLFDTIYRGHNQAHCWEEAQLLINGGALVNAKPDLLYEAASGQGCNMTKSITEFAMRNEFAPTFQNKAGQTAISQLAVFFNSDPTCVAAFTAFFSIPGQPPYKFQPNPNTRDVAGLAPVDWLNDVFHRGNGDDALRPARQQAVQVLIQHGSPPPMTLTFAQGQAAIKKINDTPKR